METNRVEITKDIQSSLSSFLRSRSYTAAAVLCDENTQAHCLPLIADLLPYHWLIRIQSGEENKHMGTCEQIWQAMTDAGLDRKALLINLGGGVIGDMGGFAASIYKRGIDFINIPTTLLAQVDASVGGKLGVDFKGFKNHIGLFRVPETVLIDAVFLKTLPERELRSGYAEVIKHGLIADKAYWESLRDFDVKSGEWNGIIEHSVEIKKRVVKSDPFESGLRKILNFGHTIGHGIESAFLGRLLHGEAIAMGMICEAFLSARKTGLREEELNAISNYLIKIFEHKEIDESYFDQIIGFIYQDKKNIGRLINSSLLKTIGECATDIPIAESDIINSLLHYNSLSLNSIV